MASADSRSGDRHAHPPVAYRVPAEIREPFFAVMERTGRGPSAVITEALREYLGKAHPDSGAPEAAES
jgi:hypothetical protein